MELAFSKFRELAREMNLRVDFISALRDDDLPTTPIKVEQAPAIQRNNKRPVEWLEGFLKRSFFESCTTHPIRRNETNRYCINCNLSACQYCMSSANHRHHKILKIYRHVYKDVVSLAAMEKYIDCSQIQSLATHDYKKTQKKEENSAEEEDMGCCYKKSV
uniref:B box-type domain-containing protein n=1 Tax=Manihot esculenta TaxID=3983 RepID=A0A2C9WLI5_MANES